MKRKYEKIKKCAPKALHYNDLAEMTNLSKREIILCLILNPKLFFKVQKQLSRKKYVIDASILQTHNLYKRLIGICESNNTIILTNVTRRELFGLKKDEDSICSADATMILAMSVEREDNFRFVKIDESLEIPDDCIVKYCADNKEHIILISSDINMTQDAREQGVEVQYIKHNIKKKSNKKNNNPKKAKKQESIQNEVPKSKVRTLYDVKKENDELFIDLFHSNSKTVLLYTKEGFVHTIGKQKLKIGDNVYITKNTGDNTAFIHFRITSNELQNNCEEIYSAIIDKEKGLECLDENYRYYVKNFMNH